MNQAINSNSDESSDESSHRRNQRHQNMDFERPVRDENKAELFDVNRWREDWPNPSQRRSPEIVEATPTLRERVKNRLNEETRLSEEQKPPCTIYMVPTNIRECNSKAYDPQVVSIGPYHKDRHLFARDGSTMQDYKWRCLDYLLQQRLLKGDVGEDALLKECLDKMMTSIPQVRSCYFDIDTHTIRGRDDEQLALMMLLDGCFIITLLLRKELDYNSKSTSTSSNVGSHHAANNGTTPEPYINEAPSLGMMWIWYFVEYDLLKLENQIPFFILDQLFDILKVPEIDKHISLINQALKLFSNLQPGKAIMFAPPPSTEIHHLLHLFHLSLLPCGEDQNQKRCNNTSEEDPFPPQWIPSATELCRAGVKFRKKKNPYSFLDVTFDKGVMEIPQLKIYDYTETLIRNLIAFEQCYPHTQMEITTYTMFMDCIVDTPEDVNLLDLRDIFVNRLSTDEAVADLFNGLCNHINYFHNFNFLSDLFIDVTRFHRSKWHRHKAILKRDYFSSPWTTISVIAACILLLLTMEQSFFAAYSYFRPT